MEERKIKVTRRDYYEMIIRTFFTELRRSITRGFKTIFKYGFSNPSWNEVRKARKGRISRQIRGIINRFTY